MSRTYNQSMFRLFDIDPATWIVCQITGNCNLNRSVARHLSIHHLGCLNHRLNLEMENMVEKDAGLGACVVSVRNTMTHCRDSLRNRALLRNLTPKTLSFITAPDGPANVQCLLSLAEFMTT